MIFLVIGIPVLIIIDAGLKLVAFVYACSGYTKSEYLKLMAVQIAINIIELFSITLLIVRLG